MFNLGDKIQSFALPGNHSGIILRKLTDMKGANGEDLYNVMDELGETHTMVPSLFDEQEEVVQEDKKEINIEQIKAEIDEEIDRIISELNLQKSDDVMVQLKNCCLVQKYIVEHNIYKDSIMEEKETYSEENIATLDLYNAVVLHVGVCTSNTLMFKKILERVGVKVEMIGLTGKDRDAKHFCNIVELDGQYYFFDSTLETSIYEQNKELSGGRLVLCCAGLGTDEYCELYTPRVLIPDNPLDNVLELPTNIASERIPITVVNSMIEEDILKVPQK